jgi:outer membrane protein OmpA-like peptidoglycan-associated protein
MTAPYRLPPLVPALTVAASLVMGCGGEPAHATAPPVSARKDAAVVGQSAPGTAAIPGLPSGFVPGGDCPDPGPGAQADIAAQASARIPLVVGLTIASIWKASKDSPDRECLKQVTAIDARSVTLSESCPSRIREGELVSAIRRNCRVDLQSAQMYHTGFEDQFPEVLRGTTTMSFSEASFATLKKTGSMPHRYLKLSYQSKPPAAGFHLREDDLGTLTFKDPSVHSAYALDVFPSTEILVNDARVALPIVNAWGFVRGDGGTGSEEQVRTEILDDPAFPLVLDYEHVVKRFSIRLIRIAFPSERNLERALERDKRADVYGIFFDFNSAELRPESEPVLHDIAEVLTRNADWKLAINGHTDNVGGDAFNLELSQRRSAAVRRALVERYQIQEARLTTAGFGASQPKESNATAEGRARNRRVELIRQ